MLTMISAILLILISTFTGLAILFSLRNNFVMEYDKKIAVLESQVETQKTFHYDERGAIIDLAQKAIDKLVSQNGELRKKNKHLFK